MTPDADGPLKADVLLIHTVLWSHYKGAVLNQLYRTLRDKRIDLHVVHIARTERGRVAIGPVDTEYHQYPYTLLFDRCMEDVPSRAKFFKVGELVRRTAAKAVVVPGYADLSSWGAWLVGKTLGKAILIASDSTREDHRRRWWKELPKRLFIRGCDAALCYGRRSKDYLIDLGMAAPRIVEGCIAVDNERIAALYRKARGAQARPETAAGPRRNFVYVGRLSPEKNVLRLLKDFRRLRSAEGSPGAADWGLVIVGDGPLRAELKACAERERIPDVSFAGGVPWREVPAHLARADVLVLPSFSETWGLVVNEAMVCGLPVAVSERCGAAADLVRNGYNGVAFDPCSPTGLFEALGFFVDNPGRLGPMGLASARMIESFTPASAARQIASAVEPYFA